MIDEIIFWLILVTSIAWTSMAPIVAFNLPRRYRNKSFFFFFLGVILMAVTTLLVLPVYYQNKVDPREMFGGSILALVRIVTFAASSVFMLMGTMGIVLREQSRARVATQAEERLNIPDASSSAT